MGDDMNELRIELLGHIRITASGSSSPLRLQRTCETLLGYLLLYSRPFCSREEIAGAFWGDHGELSARNCLNTALWRLRRALGPANAVAGEYFLTPPTGAIGFNWASDHWLDVREFEVAVEPINRRPVSQLDPSEVALAENGLGLYRGDLLADVDGDWAIGEREHLRQVYLNSLARLTDYYANRNEPGKSLTFARRILEFDPLREDIHRRVMRLHVDLGQRPLALRQYEYCRRLLQTEMGIPPMEETTSLYEQIAGALTPERAASLDLRSCERALSELNLAATRIEEARLQVVRAMAHLRGLGIASDSNEFPDRWQSAKRPRL